MKRATRFLIALLAPVLLLALLGSRPLSAVGATTSPVPLGVPGSWNLVFDDEFDGTALGQAWAPYWFRDGSVQNGTVMNSSNVSVSDGDLDLALGSGSGSIVSTNPEGGGAFQFTYGVFEARIYLPGTGDEVDNWPAFWADGQHWPADGEIDAMEGLHGVTACHFHYSGGGPSGGCPNTGPGWHVFAAEWEPGSVTYYYDGQDVGDVTTGITNEPMYLVIENSLSPDGPAVPATVKVDYVRVWQTAGDTAPPTSSSGQPSPATVMPTAPGAVGPQFHRGGMRARWAKRDRDGFRWRANADSPWATRHRRGVGR